MKFNAELIRSAHEMAKEIKSEFNDVDYRVQFGLCLSYLLKNKGEDIKMELPKLEGSEKQVKWANAIRQDILKTIEELKNILSYSKKRSEIYIKCVNAWKNYIEIETSCNIFIQSWRNIKIEKDEIRTKCYVTIKRMAAVSMNESLYFKMNKNDKQTLIENEELLRKLWDQFFRNLCRIYTNKTGIEVPGYIAE